MDTWQIVGAFVYAGLALFFMGGTYAQGKGDIHTFKLVVASAIIGVAWPVVLAFGLGCVCGEKSKKSKP